MKQKDAAAIVHNRVLLKILKQLQQRFVSVIQQAGNSLLKQQNESNGKIDEVTDEEILEAYHLLAREEGVFAEPASCAALLVSLNN